MAEGLGKDIVPLDFLRMSRDQAMQNLKLKESLQAKKEQISNEVTSFQIPDNLRPKPGDSEKQRLQKQKKIKALKLNHKLSMHNKAANQKQNSWISFESKSIKKTSKKSSIFKTSDDMHTKVGVVRK